MLIGFKRSFGYNAMLRINNNHDMEKNMPVGMNDAARIFIDAYVNASNADKSRLERDFYNNYYEAFEEALYDGNVDPVTGFQSAMELAKAGFHWAYGDVGEALLFGRGCEKDPLKALFWIDKALESGMMVSEEVGDSFRLGTNGLPCDFEKAWKCYRSDNENPIFDMKEMNECDDRGVATLEWWEYAASQVVPTLNLCKWMKGFYKRGEPQRINWLRKGVSLCVKDDKCLQDDNIEDTMAFLTECFAENPNAPFDDAMTLAMDIVGHELHTIGCDDDCALEDMLDAFFGVQGYRKEKDQLWEKINKDCEEHVKFRKWAGGCRFDLSKKRMCKCSPCWTTGPCADIPCPSNIIGQNVLIPFCRDCYGVHFYGGRDCCGEYILHHIERHKDDMFPDGMDDGFQVS